MALSYFAENIGGVEQLWVTAGTIPGTHLVASFGSGAIFNLTTIGSRVFFVIDDGVHGLVQRTSHSCPILRTAPKHWRSTR
jgi:hypothetical protein